MPSTKNLFMDSLEFLSTDPVQYSNLGKNKIKKIYCNHSVVHAIAEDGNIYSWGEDSNKTGILGLGKNYNQTRPYLNKFFVNKIITSISMSEKHACAVDVNKHVYSWGTGEHGELGQGDVTFTNNPNIVELEDYKIAKALCGDTYTVFLDYDCNILYIGEIGLSNKKILKDNKRLVYIEDLVASDIICGPGIIAILDTQGFLYLYNEEEKLYKVKIDNKVSTVRFANKNIYALSLNKELLYEFLMKNRKINSMKNNYYENIYKINPEFSSKLKIFELPYYNSVLFFMIECDQSSKQKVEAKERMIFIPLKIQKTEKSILNEISVSSNKVRHDYSNIKGNIYPVKPQNDNTSNFINSMDLSHSRIDSHKDINININLTENYDNSSNISIFPANKNHYSRKDSMSTDSHLNNNNNDTMMRDYHRHHSLNPFNKKKGQRIKKIYNLLGHIFDKKIEEIRTKFSSTMSPQEKVKKYVDLERVKPDKDNKKRFQRILEEEDSYYTENEEKFHNSQHADKKLEHKKSSVKITNISYNNKENNKTASSNNILNRSQILNKEEKRTENKNNYPTLERKKSNKPFKVEPVNKLQKFNKTTLEEDYNQLVFSKNYNINPIRSAKLEAYRYANTSDEEYEMDDHYKRSNSNSNNNDSILMHRDLDIDGLDRNIFSPPLKRSLDSKSKIKTSTLTISCNEVNLTIRNPNKSNIEEISPIEIKESNNNKFNFLEIDKNELFLDSPRKKQTPTLKTENLSQIMFFGNKPQNNIPSSENNESNRNTTVQKDQNFLVSNANSFALGRILHNQIDLSNMSCIDQANKENESINDNTSIKSLLNDKLENRKINSSRPKEESKENISNQYKRFKSNNHQNDDIYKLNHELINKINDEDSNNDKLKNQSGTNNIHQKNKDSNNVSVDSNNINNIIEPSLRKDSGNAEQNNFNNICFSQEDKSKLDPKHIDKKLESYPSSISIISIKSNKDNLKNDDQNINKLNNENFSYTKPTVKSNLSPKLLNFKSSNSNKGTTLPFSKQINFNKVQNKIDNVMLNLKEEPKHLVLNNTLLKGKEVLNEDEKPTKDNPTITYLKKPIKVISIKQRSTSNKRNTENAQTTNSQSENTLYPTNNIQMTSENNKMDVNKEYNEAYREKIQKYNENKNKSISSEKESENSSTPSSYRRDKYLSDLHNIEEKNILSSSPVDTPQFKDRLNNDLFKLKIKDKKQEEFQFSKNLSSKFKEECDNLKLDSNYEWNEEETLKLDTFRESDITNPCKITEKGIQINTLIDKQREKVNNQSNINNQIINSNYYEKPKIKKGKLKSDKSLKLKIIDNGLKNIMINDNNNNEKLLDQITENKNSYLAIEEQVKQVIESNNQQLNNTSNNRNNICSNPNSPEKITFSVEQNFNPSVPKLMEMLGPNKDLNSFENDQFSTINNYDVLENKMEIDNRTNNNIKEGLSKNNTENPINISEINDNNNKTKYDKESDRIIEKEENSLKEEKKQINQDSDIDNSNSVINTINNCNIEPIDKKLNLNNENFEQSQKINDDVNAIQSSVEISEKSNDVKIIINENTSKNDEELYKDNLNNQEFYSNSDYNYELTQSMKRQIENSKNPIDQSNVKMIDNLENKEYKEDTKHVVSLNNNLDENNIENNSILKFKKEENESNLEKNIPDEKVKTNNNEITIEEKINEKESKSPYEYMTEVLDLREKRDDLDDFTNKILLNENNFVEDSLKPNILDLSISKQTQNYKDEYNYLDNLIDKSDTKLKAEIEGINNKTTDNLEKENIKEEKHIEEIMILKNESNILDNLDLKEEKVKNKEYNIEKIDNNNINILTDNDDKKQMNKDKEIDEEFKKINIVSDRNDLKIDLGNVFPNSNHSSNDNQYILIQDYRDKDIDDTSKVKGKMIETDNLKSNENDSKQNQAELKNQDYTEVTNLSQDANKKEIDYFSNTKETEFIDKINNEIKSKINNVNIEYLEENATSQRNYQKMADSKNLSSTLQITENNDTLREKVVPNQIVENIKNISDTVIDQPNSKIPKNTEYSLYSFSISHSRQIEKDENNDNSRFSNTFLHSIIPTKKEMSQLLDFSVQTENLSHHEEIIEENSKKQIVLIEMKEYNINMEYSNPNNALFSNDLKIKRNELNENKKYNEETNQFNNDKETNKVNDNSDNQGKRNEVENGKNEKSNNNLIGIINDETNFKDNDFEVKVDANTNKYNGDPIIEILKEHQSDKINNKEDINKEIKNLEDQELNVKLHEKDDTDISKLIENINIDKINVDQHENFLNKEIISNTEINETSHKVNNTLHEIENSSKINNNISSEINNNDLDKVNNKINKEEENDKESNKIQDSEEKELNSIINDKNDNSINNQRNPELKVDKVDGKNLQIRVDRDTEEKGLTQIEGESNDLDIYYSEINERLFENIKSKNPNNIEETKVVDPINDSLERSEDNKCKNKKIIKKKQIHNENDKETLVIECEIENIDKYNKNLNQGIIEKEQIVIKDLDTQELAIKQDDKIQDINILNNKESDCINKSINNSVCCNDSANQIEINPTEQFVIKNEPISEKENDKGDKKDNTCEEDIKKNEKDLLKSDSIVENLDENYSDNNKFDNNLDIFTNVNEEIKESKEFNTNTNRENKENYSESLNKEIDNPDLNDIKNNDKNSNDNVILEKPYISIQNSNPILQETNKKNEEILIDKQNISDEVSYSKFKNLSDLDKNSEHIIVDQNEKNVGNSEITDNKDIRNSINLDENSNRKYSDNLHNPEYGEVLHIIINKRSSNNNELHDQIIQQVEEENKKTKIKQKSIFINSFKNIFNSENVMSLNPNDNLNISSIQSTKRNFDFYKKSDLDLETINSKTFNSSKSDLKFTERSLLKSASQNSLSNYLIRLNQNCEDNHSRKSQSINSYSNCKTPEKAIFEKIYDNENKDFNDMKLRTGPLKKNDILEEVYDEQKVLSQTEKKDSIKPFSSHQKSFSGLANESNNFDKHNSEIKFIDNYEVKDNSNKLIFNKSLQQKSSKELKIKLNKKEETKEKKINSNNQQKNFTFNKSIAEKKKTKDNERSTNQKVKITNLVTNTQDSQQFKKKKLDKQEENTKLNQKNIEKSSSIKLIANKSSNKETSNRNLVQNKSGVIKSNLFIEKSLDQSNAKKDNNKKISLVQNSSAKTIKDFTSNTNVEVSNASNIENSVGITFDRQNPVKVEVKGVNVNKYIKRSNTKKSSNNPIKLKKESNHKEAGESIIRDDPSKTIKTSFQVNPSLKVTKTNDEDDKFTKSISFHTNNTLSDIKRQSSVIDNSQLPDKKKLLTLKNHINENDLNKFNHNSSLCQLNYESKPNSSSQALTPQQNLTRKPSIDKRNQDELYENINIEKKKSEKLMKPSYKETIPQSEEEYGKRESRIFLRERKETIPKTQSQQGLKFKRSFPKEKLIYSFSKQFKEDYENLRDEEMPILLLKDIGKRKTTYKVEKRPKLKANQMYQIKELKDDKDDIEYEFNTLNSERQPRSTLISPVEVNQKENSQYKSKKDISNKNYQFNKLLKDGILVDEENDHIYEYNLNTQNIQGVCLNENNYSSSLSPVKPINKVSSNIGMFSFEDNSLQELDMKNKIIDKIRNDSVSPTKINKETSFGGINSITLKNVNQDDAEKNDNNTNKKSPNHKRKKKLYKKRHRAKLAFEKKIQADRMSISLNNSFDKEVLKNFEFENSNHMFLSLIEEEELLFKKKENIKKVLREENNNSDLGLDLTLIKNKIKDKINQANTYQEANYEKPIIDKNPKFSNSLSFNKKEYYEEPNIYPPPYIEETKKKRSNMNVIDFEKYFNYIHDDDILPVESPYHNEKDKYVIPKEIERYLKLIEKNKDLINDEILEAFSDGSLKENNNTPTRFRKKIIKNLENFKLGNVEQKLQNLFQKYNKLGSISPFSNNCLTPKQNLIDDHDNSKLSELEPIELDKSQLTMKSSQMSSRISAKNLVNLNLGLNDPLKLKLPMYMRKNINHLKDQANFTFEEAVENRKNTKTKLTIDPKNNTPMKLTLEKHLEKGIKERHSQKQNKNQVLKPSKNNSKVLRNSSNPNKIKSTVNKINQNKSTDKIKTYYNTLKRPERLEEITDKTRNRKEKSFNEKDFFSWNIPTDPPLSCTSNKTDAEKSISEEFKDITEKVNNTNDSIQHNYMRRKSFKLPLNNNLKISNTFIDKNHIVNKFLEQKNDKKNYSLKRIEVRKVAGSKNLLKTNLEMVGSKEKNKQLQISENPNKNITFNNSLNKLQKNPTNYTPVSPKNQQTNTTVFPAVKTPLNELKPVNDISNKSITSPQLINTGESMNLITKVRKNLNTHLSIKSQKK